jgi:hypothetical protein
MKCKRLQILGVLLLALAVPLTMQGQVDRGTVTGTVSDSSGAVIASVDVIATHVSTGEQFKGTSNGLGFFSLLNLPIGTYSVSFRKAGFKDLDQSGIIIEAQHTVQLNAVLHVGNVSETVTVTGTPVLELQTEVGTNMNAQEMTDLPLSVDGGRDIMTFAFAVTPNVGGNSWTSYIAGSQAFTKNVMIDGTSTDSGIVGDEMEQEPSMDAIQESQVDTTGLRAEDGRSGGGAFLYEMKSGTNRFHGATFGFLANEFLNANTWENNWYLSQCASGDTSCTQDYRRAMDRYFDYGASGGGPLWKRRKMFIFVAYEKYMQADWLETPASGTVPSAKMLTGDFSELLPAAAAAQGQYSDHTPICTASPCPILTKEGGAPYADSAGNTIYYGSIFAPSGNVYPGNIITDPISPIAQKVISIYQKDYQPTSGGLVNNYPSLGSGVPWFHQTQLSFKYDWAVRDNDHIAVSYIYTLRPRSCTGPCGDAGNSVLWQAGTTTGGPLSDGQQQIVIGNEYRGSETHTFSPRLLNVIAYTFNSFENKSTAITSIAGSTNWPGQIGLGSEDPTNVFPYITFGGSPNGLGETTIGNNYAPGGGYDAYNGIVNETLSWTKSRHMMKFGMEYRELGFNQDSGKAGELQYSFSNNTFAPTNTSIQPYVGSAFANFELGEVQSASQGVAFNTYSRRKELAFFGQDDIRVNKRFTVSADLRWELTRPLHNLRGYWSNFDVTAPSLPYGGIPGAITWLPKTNASFETYTDWHQIAPKLGGAYQITDKIVARGSVGINFVPLGWNVYNAVPYGSEVGYTAVNRVTEVSVKAPAFQWDSGYPGVYVAPTGPDPSSSYIPWGPASVDPHTRQLGFTENWFAGVQYQLPGNAKIEVSYIGNSGRNLHDGALVPTNYPTWPTYQALLNSGNEWDWVYDSGSAASAGVPYPYPGFAGEAYFAIFPYPQIQAGYDGGIFFTNSPLGQSGYNAYTVEGMKQHGSLNLDVSYNRSRTTGNTGSAFIETWSMNYWWQDPYKYKQEARWPNIYDTVKGYLTYGLPLGQGRRFLSDSRILDYLVGGWIAGTIVSYGNAGEMGAVGSTNYYPGWSAVYTNVAPGASFKNQFKKYNPSWNPTVAGTAPDPDSLFVNPNNFTNPTYGQLGNSPTLFTNWRGWAAPSENASLLKKTKFGSDGRYVVTLRAEFFDVFNRHYWDNPDTSFGTGYFGHVDGVYGNRTGQLGARFEW